jgi:hypothetical protein
VLWEQEGDNVRAAYTRKAGLLLKSCEKAIGFQSKTVGKAGRGASGKPEAKEWVKKARILTQKDDIHRKRSRRKLQVAVSEETRAGLGSSLIPLEKSGLIRLPSLLLF